MSTMTSRIVTKRATKVERKRQLIRRKRRLLIIGAVVAVGALIFEHVLAGQVKVISDSIAAAQSRMSSVQAQELVSLSKMRLSQAETQLSRDLADPETEPAISKYNLQKEIIQLEQMYGDPCSGLLG
jgi:hypothetical protein